MISSQVQEYCPVGLRSRYEREGSHRVDDDPDIVAGLQSRLRWLGYETLTAQTGGQALELIAQEHPALVLLDVELPGMSGLDILKALASDPRAQGWLPAIIILTAHGTITRAVEAMKLGAYDFLTKPFDPEYLELLVGKALERESLRSEVRHLRAEIESRYATIVAESPKMKAVLEAANRASQSSAVVLLTGETGTGKELIARAIHRWSPRSAHPFMAVNCAALPEALVENELFGHERGAYTGASGMHEGKIESANRGTVFFDEIGDMPRSLQGQLLRLVQDNEFQRVGGTQNIRVDVRFVAATNRDLASLVNQGHFRQDLFFRLNVVSITIPPLRERREDIPSLVNLILQREAKRAGNGTKRLSQEALEALCVYPWPGNVRELENVLARALILSTGDELNATSLGLSAAQPTDPPSEPPLEQGMDYHEAMGRHSRWLLLESLRRTGWNQTKAAAYLKLQRT